MPKNKGKGDKNRRRGKNKTDDDGEKSELAFKSDGQEYAKVLRILGNCRLEMMCSGSGDGDPNSNRLAFIRGNIQNKDWIKAGDIILVGLRDFQDRKADVMHKYTAGDVWRLKALYPENSIFNEYEDDGLDRVEFAD